MSDDYVRVEARIVALSAKAVQVEVDGDLTWVPRSLLHGADDHDLSAEAIGSDMRLRIREWFAEREGLA